MLVVLPARRRVFGKHIFCNYSNVKFLLNYSFISNLYKVVFFNYDFIDIFWNCTMIISARIHVDVVTCYQDFY